MNPILLRYAGFALVAVIAGGGGGYLAVNNGKQSPPQVVQSGTIPGQPFPGQGVPAIPAIPGTHGTSENKITVLAPNGSETLFTHKSSVYGGDLITWSGNTKRGVKIALLREEATSNTDPTPFIVGWIFGGTIPVNVVAWSNRALYNDTFTEEIYLAREPYRNYKILVVADDGKGKITLWNNNTNKPAANFDISDRPFTVAAIPQLRVVSPNGGEVFRIGDTVPIRFEAINMGDWNWVSMVVAIGRTRDAYGNVRPINLVNVGPETNTYTYNWTIRADEFAPGDDYYVLVDDSGLWRIPGLPNPDRSDAVFSVVAP